MAGLAPGKAAPQAAGQEGCSHQHGAVLTGQPRAEALLRIRADFTPNLALGSRSVLLSVAAAAAPSVRPPLFSPALPTRWLA